MASRKTAAILITIVGTLAVVAATIGVTHYIGERKEIAQSQPVESAEPEKAIIAERNPANADTIAKKEAPLPQTIVFKGENLETILADIARYYGASVKFNQDAAKSLQLYLNGIRLCRSTKLWSSSTTLSKSTSHSPTTY